MLGWAGPEIAKQVEDSGLEQSYTGRAVNLRLDKEFAKLQKLCFSQFESEDAVRLRINQEFAKLQKLVFSQSYQETHH